MRTELGSISLFEVGEWDDHFGVKIELKGGLAHAPWGVMDFQPCSREYLQPLLEQAKKSFVSQMKGTPVEATFDGNLLKSWRVLEEVL